MRIARGIGAALLALGCGGGSSSTGPGPNPVLTTLTVSPAVDTIVGAPGATVQLAAVAKDQNGNTMTGLGAPTWQSSADTIAAVNGSGLVTSAKLGGPVTITATLTANGVTKQSTATVTVVDVPTTAAVTATTSLQFTPTPVDVKAGGTVTWTFQSVSHNVTFDTPSPAGTPADIATTSNSSVSRTFTQAGTYNYHCTIHAGMTGKVIVH